MATSKERIEVIREIRKNKSNLNVNHISVQNINSLKETSNIDNIVSKIYDGFIDVLNKKEAYSYPDSMIDALQKSDWKLIRAGISKLGWNGLYGIAEEILDEFSKEQDVSIDEDTTRQLDWKQSRARKKKQTNLSHKKHIRHLKEKNLDNLIEYCFMNKESVMNTPINDKPSHMVKSNLYQISQQTAELEKVLDDSDIVAPWIETKVAFAANEINAIYNHMLYRFHKNEENELKIDTGEEKYISEQKRFSKKDEPELDWNPDVKEYSKKLPPKIAISTPDKMDLEMEFWKGLSDVQKRLKITDPYELLSSTLEHIPELFKTILSTIEPNKLLNLAKKVIEFQKDLSFRKNLNEKY